MLDPAASLPEAVAAQLRELAEKTCADCITAAECQQLDALLRDRPEAQSYWLAYVGLHAQLGWQFGPRELPTLHESGMRGVEPAPLPLVDADTALPPLGPAPARTNTFIDVCIDNEPEVRHSPLVSPASRWSAWFISSANCNRMAGWLLVGGSGVLLAMVLVWITAWHRPAGPAGAPAAAPFATLSGGVAPEWEDPGGPRAVGQPLSAGRHGLVTGVAKIIFRGGAVAVIEAPADFEIVGPDHAVLHSGQVVVHAEEEAKGFVLDTARATVVDLGTEFGVKVKPSSETEVHVFEGSVTARAHVADGGADAVERLLRAGQAIHYAASVHDAPQVSLAAPKRFVRRLPEQVSDPARRLPMNGSHLDAICIAPAPPRVVIDGDLSEWDRQAMFRAVCDPPFGDACFVEGGMMYDQQCLYIAAHVGDPWPMCNILDPQIDADRAWCGGAIQIRLSTDRARPWPLDAELPSLVRRRRPVRPSDVSDRIAHLTLWYYAPGQKPCLHVSYGMDRHGDVVNPPGFHGAFRRDAAGQGYVAEYAIPWSVLGAADDPPRAGDVLATAWNVHWSNESGRIWQGHLVEILNPRQSGWTFTRAATWGRAIYGPALPGGTSPPLTVP